MKKLYPRLVSIDTFTGHGPYACYEDMVEVSKNKYVKLNKKWREYFKDELKVYNSLANILTEEIQKEVNKEVLKRIKL